ncbi:VraH family peptide resistance protein [Abyssicoccus albus]|uniref:Uncharacterized protein n=1 Tax=Abyssicoccus albus TaxID=1817405 RepID=A0A3N5CCL4_9BACL|nr:VraH family protein [Abyssicoccus albus]RPF57762.1 hypothetical protein EDD62_0396 [Abyssicoccus albus]
MVNYLMEKKWESEDFVWLILMIFIASTFTTPLLGIPLGIVAYFFFFCNIDDNDDIKPK